MLDLAIESFRELHPDQIPEIEPVDADDLHAAALALRERDRAVARPVLLRTAAAVIRSAQLHDRRIRLEAVSYLGDHWEYVNDTPGVVRTLIHALFDSSTEMQIAAAHSLAKLGQNAESALDALRVVLSESTDAELAEAMRSAVAHFKGQP